MSEMSGGVHGDGESVGATRGNTGGASRGAAGNGSTGADARGGTWERASGAATNLRERVVERAGTLGRRVREAPLTQRLGEAIEERPWTALMVALGIGAALAAATGRASADARVRTTGGGDDYLAEYEDALVAGSGRWAARGRAAVSDVGAARTAASGTTAGGTDEWRPSDEQLAGEHDALGEMGRGLPANPGAMEGRVTRESWERGMIE